MDRDGVLNAHVYIGGELDSPLSVAQVKLLPRVGQAICLLNDAGLAVVVVSNQPVVAKAKTTHAELTRITETITDQIGEAGGVLDGIYYCLHHPDAVVEDLHGVCDCRKPAPGLLLQAARDLDLDLSQSFMVGDRMSDIQAGYAAGCTTVLVDGPANRIRPRSRVRAHHQTQDLYAAAEWIVGQHLRTDTRLRMAT